MNIIKTIGTIFLLALTCISANAQKMLPKSVASELPSGKPLVISFWSTTCKPCILELNALSEVYEDWQEEFDFEVVAISTDDVRSSSKVMPFVKGRGWPFKIVLDQNADKKRAMNVQETPSLFIADKNGKIVYSHVGYTPGSEQTVYEELKKLK